MLLTRVLAGNAKKLTVADPSLTSPPPGFDSVCITPRLVPPSHFLIQIRGVPGGGGLGVGLKYDELIVYSNDQIRPFYLVLYA